MTQTEQADKIIRTHVAWAAGAGLIPFFGVDWLAVNALQLDMLRELSKVYGIDFDASSGKARILALTSSGVTRIGARLGAEALKFIPIIGSILGGAAMSVMSGASTYALGETFKRHFDGGGTLDDFDPASVTDFFKTMAVKGKEFTEKLQRENSKVQLPPEDAAMKRLEKLTEMRKNDLLTDEEFSTLKKQLIDDL